MDEVQALYNIADCRALNNDYLAELRLIGQFHNYLRFFTNVHYYIRVTVLGAEPSDIPVWFKFHDFGLIYPNDFDL